LPRFGSTPHVLLLVLRSALLREVGGFCEDYGLASNEDKDLCFTLWEAGYEVVVDHRVVVPHEGGATWKTVLGHCRARRLWKKNRRLFKRRWRHRLGPRGG
jgi:GT2 family glycosyltransferase